MHEKPRDDRGQGKHTAPPRAARKTHLKRRAATDTKRKPPEEPAAASPAELRTATTPKSKQPNTLPEARERPRSHAERRRHTGTPTATEAAHRAARAPQDKHGDTCRDHPEEQNRGGDQDGSGSRPRRARTREKARKHPRQGKTTTKSRGGKKRSQRSERGTPRRSEAEAPAADGQSNRARATISAAARTTCRSRGTPRKERKMSKYFDKVKTLDDLKKMYKELAKQHHPDRGGDVATMQAINAEFDKMVQYFAKHGSKTEREKASAAPPEKFREIINKLLTLPHLQIEIIGGWIWLDASAARYLRKIQQLGFLYSKKQKRYYLPDMATRSGRGSRYTMQDIRDIYGSTIIENNTPLKFLI